ncbi:hypothetical protein [Hirschia litorea]|uniref:Lipoprotein n=1 Tax=Hirschia litorea TaxID=1199156 RepID=A0ABW2IL49_9PROT
MKYRLPLLISTALLASACASTTTPPPATPASAPQVTETKGPVALTTSTAAARDISATSSWHAVELLWPESPYMTLHDASAPDSDVSPLSFNCNTDTGALSGTLNAQPKENSGKAASFSLRTSDGEAFTLLGMYTRSKSEPTSNFVFKTDWRAMKAISNSERVDIISPDGQSQIALVKDVAPHRGDTQLLASTKNFAESQEKLYYYCNPK